VLCLRDWAERGPDLDNLTDFEFVGSHRCSSTGVREHVWDFGQGTRSIVEYAPQRRFDLASIGSPLHPVFGHGGPSLRTIDYPSAEGCLASGSGSASADRIPILVLHFIIVRRAHEVRERKGRALNQEVVLSFDALRPS
jgi:hypothetical protein